MSNQENCYYSETEEYISRIQAHFDLMSDSEKKIAVYLMENTDIKNQDFNINKLAKESSTSVSTVVRFCRTLGFNGFAEFKFYVQKGILTHIGENVKISDTDSCNAIKHKVAEFAKKAIDDTIMMMNNDSLENAISAISNARQLHIFGSGSSFGIAQSAATTFMKLGIPSYVLSDPLTHVRAISFLTPDDVVLGINNCGHLKDVVDALMIARKQGVTTISITGVTNSLLTKYSDIVLYTSVRNNELPMNLPTIIACQIITIQTLQVGVLVRNHDRLAERIVEMRNIADLKRYELDVESIDIERVSQKPQP